MKKKTMQRKSGGSKNPPNLEDREQLVDLLTRSPRWHRSANAIIRFGSGTLGYTHHRFQTSGEWVSGFNDALLTSDFWSERASVLDLRNLGKRRFSVILLCLFLLAQHARVQFLQSGETAAKKETGKPFEELNDNGHNIDWLLLRIVSFLGGHRDQTLSPTTSRIIALLWSALDPFLGATATDITPHRVGRWAHIGDVAAGIAPRSVSRLEKTWGSTANRPSDVLLERARFHFNDVREAWPFRRIWNAFVLVVSTGVIIHAIAYWSHRLLLR